MLRSTMVMTIESRASRWTADNAGCANKALMLMLDNGNIQRCLYHRRGREIFPRAACSGTLHVASCSHSGHTAGCSQQMQQVVFVVGRGTPRTTCHSSTSRIEPSRLGSPLMSESKLDEQTFALLIHGCGGDIKSVLHQLVVVARALQCVSSLGQGRMLCRPFRIDLPRHESGVTTREHPDEVTRSYSCWAYTKRPLLCLEHAPFHGRDDMGFHYGLLHTIPEGTFFGLEHSALPLMMIRRGCLSPSGVLRGVLYTPSKHSVAERKIIEWCISVH